MQQYPKAAENTIAAPLLALENIYIRLIFVGIPHDAVAVKSVCGFTRISPPRKVAQRGEALGCARARVGAVVGHEKRGCKYRRTRAPRIGRILPRDACESVLMDHIVKRNKLSGPKGAAVAARLRT